MTTLILTDAGEKMIGTAFLEGHSVTEIGQRYGFRRETVEAVLRKALQHLIEIKRAVGESQQDFAPNPREPHDDVPRETAGHVTAETAISDTEQ